MKAMILAAGLGTRLRPLTDDRPKALVKVAGRPLLEHVIRKLKAAGVTDLIINLHHFPEQIIEFVRRHDSFGLRIEFSPEEDLLDTGGGLRQAAWFFDDGEPFLLYNVDVLSTIDLAAMRQQHRQHGALATLAVRQRRTSRYFLFDENDMLVGWRHVGRGVEKICRPVVGQAAAWAFMGIHVISPALFTHLHETGAFSIVDGYLRLAGEGQAICAFRADAWAWIDCGRPENLATLDAMPAAELAAITGAPRSE